MKFLNLGLFTLSSLLAISYAAPTTKGSSASVVQTSSLAIRADSDIVTKLQTTIVEVKKHTASINATISGVSKTVSENDKTGIISSVKGDVSIIVQLISTVGSDCSQLVDVTVEKVIQEEIIQLVLELIFEILYTLKNVLTVLQITIFELLGSIVFTLLTAIGHLLAVLNVVIEGLLQAVFAVLGSVFVLVSTVLSGLLPIVLGLVGDVLSKVTSLASCIL